MKDRKINLDRPQLTHNEIMAGKNFEAIVQNHQFMSKPFYKQTWFFGTTGLASLGIIIGSTLAFQNPPSTDNTSALYYNTDALPDSGVDDNQLIVMNENESVNTNDESNLIQNQLQNTLAIEETFTPDKNLKTNKTETDRRQNPIPDQSIPLELKVEEPLVTNQPKNEVAQEMERNKALDLYPRISDKIDGSITRDELLDNKGITTEGDVNIIHFELHLIDGLGGKVYSEDGNQLNQEMKEALEQVGQGETIYFENIRGQVKNGTEVRLNPLRYVLLN